MRFGVLRKVITSHKALATNRTNITFLSGVCAVVTSEFVGASELFHAASPVAMERALACMRAEMRFKMTALSVLFIAAWVVTSMYFLLLLGFSTRIPAPPLFWF